MTTPRELAAALVRRHKQALDDERARASEVRSGLEKVICQEGQKGRFSRAFLIGSLARGDFGASSDVDVVVEGLDPNEVGPLYGRLVEALGTEVDLLRLEELPPAFKQRVEEEGALLHGA